MLVSQPIWHGFVAEMTLGWCLQTLWSVSQSSPIFQLSHWLLRWINSSRLTTPACKLPQAFATQTHTTCNAVHASFDENRTQSATAKNAPTNTHTMLPKRTVYPALGARTFHFLFLVISSAQHLCRPIRQEFVAVTAIVGSSRFYYAHHLLILILMMS